MGPGYGPPPGQPSGPNQGPGSYPPGYGYQPYPPPPRGASHLNGPTGPPGPSTSNNGKVEDSSIHYIHVAYFVLRNRAV